eukprot:TRINITY_DN105276_c0_g1_i1.p1 TRINITY_DN105276_c0_g1~~TRINITY_DN105276_c0_g1_i1.p1  ORF type:complete len:133 (+),score=21.61 TRINITY_DN105276_c0_g1_i1:48-401(+)
MATQVCLSEPQECVKWTATYSGSHGGILHLNFESGDRVPDQVVVENWTGDRLEGVQLHPKERIEPPVPEDAILEKWDLDDGQRHFKIANGALHARISAAAKNVLAGGGKLILINEYR